MPGAGVVVRQVDRRGCLWANSEGRTERLCRHTGWGGPRRDGASRMLPGIWPEQLKAVVIVGVGKAVGREVGGKMENSALDS